jgi:N-acetylmuramoyl-L-alanine amidase
MTNGYQRVPHRMNIIDAPSPNFGPRKEGKKIKYLILHYTGTKTAFESLCLLQGKDPVRQVSAHYMVDEYGMVTRFVDEAMRAWHAGKSYWEKEDDINSCSIGIEIQNPGHEHGYVPFPAEQMQVVTQLCQEIMERNNILPCNVLAHSDIAPERKEDPGELFPWEELAQAGVGIWPEEGEFEDGDIDKILTSFGYDPKVDLKTRVVAFQRHFQPEAFLTPETLGTPDLNTVKRLQSLLRQKLAMRPRI